MHPLIFYPSRQGHTLPVPILIPCDEVRIQFGLVFGEGHAITLEDSLVVHPLQGDSALHASHGADELGEAVVAIHIRGRQQVLLSSDACELKHRADVGLRVVLLGGRPPADDVPHRKAPALMAKAIVVGLQDSPCGPVAVGHRLELNETLVCLCFRSTLPLVGRVTDV